MPDKALPQPGEAVERTDVEPRPVLAVVAILFVVLALAAGVIWGLLRWWQLPVDAGPGAPMAFRMEAPSLQAAPQDERAAYFAEKDRLLHGYGWVDRRSGTARIPIEMAMDLLAARGAKGKQPAGPGARP